MPRVAVPQLIFCLVAYFACPSFLSFNTLPCPSSSALFVLLLMLQSPQVNLSEQCASLQAQNEQLQLKLQEAEMKAQDGSTTQDDSIT